MERRNAIVFFFGHAYRQRPGVTFEQFLRQCNYLEEPLIAWRSGQELEKKKSRALNLLDQPPARSRLSYPLSSSFHRSAPLVGSLHHPQPPYLDSSREHLPQHLFHLPQPPARLLPGRNRPNHHRSPLEPLEALLHRRSVSPVIFRPNRLQEWIRGELLVLLGLFPFHCAPPAPVNGRRRTCCRLSRGVKEANRGRSAQGGDSPPVRLGWV